MDYSHVDLGDLIDTSCVQELASTYPCLECMNPSPTQDDFFVDLEVVVTTEVRIPSMTLGNPSLFSPREPKVLKKRKVREYTHGKEEMDMDDFEFDEVILKVVVVLETPITYFDEGIFGLIDLKRDLFQHFGTKVERSQVRAARKSEGGTYGKLIADRLFEAVCLAREGELSLKGYKSEVQASRLEIAKYEKLVKDKYVLIVEKDTKILNLENKVIDKVEKLRKADTYCYEKGEAAKHFKKLVKGGRGKEQCFSIANGHHVKPS